MQAIQTNAIRIELKVFQVQKKLFQKMALANYFIFV